MTICRLIAPEWARKKNPKLKRAIEGVFTPEQLTKYNKDGYNIYFLPNTPSEYNKNKTIDGTDIDQFDWVFVDCDLKHKVYGSKDEFLEVIGASGLTPTKVVDSGNGVHVYWKITNLDSMSYLRFQRRLMRLFDTDPAVGQLFQLMRLPGYYNTKIEGSLKLCELLFESDQSYTAEELHSLLPPITKEDEDYCKQHYDKTYNLNQSSAVIDDTIPTKFAKLLKSNEEVAELWINNSEDRSKNDYRLAHLLFASGFTKDEALSTLVNTAKALERAPIHRKSYAENIVNKIWTFELGTEEEKLELSMTVGEILRRSGDTLKGTPLRCHERIDNTAHGFRLGQVIGLVAGSGVGKTAFALNMFQWWVQKNPDYEHFFIPLEQPANEIADRWRTMCQDNTNLYDKVHVISNYDETGNFRHLSFDEIKDYIEKFQRVTKKKVGCIVIDHIGALKKKGKDGENQDLMDICHAMKAFAVQTNTLLVMQSQAPREKAGIGDLELNKDAAYGTVYFESYCDYLITLWQPLKRCHDQEACPTVTAFKFCKIRHKKARIDVIKEDVCYYMYFDSTTEQMRDLTQDEVTAFNYWNSQATNKRKSDRKTDIVEYKSVPWNAEGVKVETTVKRDRLSSTH